MAGKPHRTQKDEGGDWLLCRLLCARQEHQDDAGGGRASALCASVG